MSRNQKCGVDIKSIMAMVLLLALGVMANTAFATPNAQKDIVLQGKVLKVLINGKYKVLKRGDFYGYGWLDDHRIFIAYQQEGYSEAIVHAEVIDLRKARVVKIDIELGANGETNFDVNSRTSEVVFNAFGEDKAGPEGGVTYAIKLITFDRNSSAYRVETIKENIYCKDVLWVDDNTIGATLYDGKETFVKIPVPRQKPNPSKAP
jgi:hypothetical protein